VRDEGIGSRDNCELRENSDGMFGEDEENERNGAD
jgi:hypothetical protein